LRKGLDTIFADLPVGQISPHLMSFVIARSQRVARMRAR
jgi:hypothetical protein